MNKARRKEINRARDLLAEARAIVEAVKEEEQEAKDNLPESIADGEKGSAMEEAIDKLEEVASSLEEIENNLEEATS